MLQLDSCELWRTRGLADRPGSHQLWAKAGVHRDVLLLLLALELVIVRFEIISDLRRDVVLVTVSVATCLCRDVLCLSRELIGKMEIG